jgi:hypothetical protein
MAALFEAIYLETSFARTTSGGGPPRHFHACPIAGVFELSH